VFREQRGVHEAFTHSQPAGDPQCLVHILQSFPAMGTTTSTLQASSSSTPHFQLIFEKALKEYKKKTGEDLATHPLAAQINGSASPEAILAILEAKARELDQSQSGDERLTKWLGPTVNILNALSATLGQGVGIVSSATTFVTRLCPNINL
jgi:hypothetical protein